MDEGSTDLLKTYYVVFLKNLTNKTDVVNGSAILAFIKLNNNERYRIMSDSALPIFNQPQEQIKDLLSQNLIRNAQKINYCYISAFGIWEIEKDMNCISEISIIKYLDEEKFSFEEDKKPLTSIESVTLLSMIAARTFSNQSPVDLDPDNIQRDKWKEIFELSTQELLDYKIIKESEKRDFFKKTGNEHQISYVFRRRQTLPEKTIGIYKSDRDHKYWLDMPQERSKFQENLGFLFWCVFKDQLSFPNLERIYKFCQDISQKYGVYVFDTKIHKFSNPEYDILIKDSIIFGITNKKKWEKNN